MELEGYSITKGYAVGKVVQLNEYKINITKKEINDTKLEFKRLRTAINNVVEKTSIKKNMLKNKLTSDELLVYESHQLMAQDPELLALMKNEIETTKICAEYVVEKIMNQFINIFQSMEDDYFKERASDVYDVKKVLIEELLSINNEILKNDDEDIIIVAETISPQQILNLDMTKVKGIITEYGNKTAHSSIIIKSLGVPAIIGVKDLFKKVKDRDYIILDTINNKVIKSPSEKELALYTELSGQFEEKNDFTNLKDLNIKSIENKKIEIAANISYMKDLDSAIEVNSDGIGLFRTEYLFMNRNEEPTEEEQFIVYKNILEKMGDKKVIIRTLDIGGDKNIRYLDLNKENNPFLGYRAIRFSLSQINIFKRQIRALLRASFYGNLHIMFPMITVLEELLEVKKIIKDVKETLIKEGLDVGVDIPIGIMVETPSVAIMSHHFAKHVDFFSIGTNDLIQYMMAADRLNEKIAYLYQPLNPAILNIIKQVIDSAHENNIWVGLCGEMANNKVASFLLVGLGIDELSMSSNYILPIKDFLYKNRELNSRKISEDVLKLSSEKEVINYLREKLK